VRSVVIVGEGGMFCAGGNLQRLLANRQQPPEVQAQSIEGLHDWIETIRTFPKPVIAAVEGAAAGAGLLARAGLRLRRGRLATRCSSWRTARGAVARRRR
jgi:enoyl-CoA hydratase/carnithine racemase